MLCLFLVPAVSGQNKNNNLVVNSYNTSFTLSNATALETQQVKSNAFQVMVSSKNNNKFSVYGKVSSSTSSTGTNLPPSVLSVKLNSVTPSVIVNYNTITLSYSDQLLQQVQTSGSFWNTYSSINFDYDLLLAPVGYDYPPGNYLLTLLFTMTQP